VRRADRPARRDLPRVLRPGLLLSLTVIGLVISVPAWLGCLIYTAIDAPRAARERNLRLRA
jgi:hypothetical protein